MNKLGQAVQDLVLKLEAVPMTFVQGFTAFVGVILVKAILENFANGTLTGTFTADPADLIHYFLWFAGSYLSLVLVTYFITRQPIGKISVFLLFVHLLVWLTAIIDLVVFQGNAHKLSYIYLGPSDLINSWLSAGRRYSGVGLGQMIIVPAVVICTMIYCLVKTKRTWRTIFLGLLSYTVIFLWGAFPSLVKIVYDLFHGAIYWNASSASVSQFFQNSVVNSVLIRNIISTNTGTLGVNPQIPLQVDLFSELFFLVVFLQLIVWAYLRNREQFRAVIGNVRFFGIIHYYLSLGIGLALAEPSAVIRYNWVFWMNAVLLFLCYYFAYMFAMGTNDIADVEIDRVTNNDRPLTRGIISVAELSDFNFGFLALGLISGFLCGPLTFYLVSVAIIISYVYSVKPFRLKRVPVLSTFLIAVVSLTASLAGFYFLNFSRAISNFPLTFLFAILTFHTIWGNVKDIKDREGDLAGGIKTIANIFLEPTSKKIMAALAAIGFLLVPLLLQEPTMFILAIPAALVSIFLVMRKNYSHYSVFAVYFAFIIFGFFLLA